jgi:hypothetical protein
VGVELAGELSMRINSLAGLVLLLLASSAFSQSWTIGNDRIERKVTFDPASGLFTERLSDLKTHTDFIVPGKPRRISAR